MVRDLEDWFDIRSEGSLQMSLIGGDGYHIFLGFDFSAGEIQHCYWNHSVSGFFCCKRVVLFVVSASAGDDFRDGMKLRENLVVVET